MILIEINFLFFYKDFASDSFTQSARNGKHIGLKYVWSHSVCSKLIRIILKLQENNLMYLNIAYIIKLYMFLSKSDSLQDSTISLLCKV
jgi:hypothetical protein